MELISVVLVTYNRAHVLGKTIDSILNQTYSNFELLICDDYSPDYTQSVCLQYEDKDSRIRYFRNSKNLRMPNNLNLGISRSQGRYIANIHDGDFMLIRY
jgi:glycosyltransferase involved in cell wall biosynthesis